MAVAETDHTRCAFGRFLNSDDARSLRTLSPEVDQILKEIGNDINAVMASMAAAIEEQSATTQEISGNVSQAALAERLNKMTGKFKLV